MNRVNPSKSPFENNNAKTEDFICATCAKMFHFSTQCEYLLFPLSLHSFTYANAMLGILHKKPSVKTLFMLNILLLLLQVHTFTVNPYLLCNLCKKMFHFSTQCKYLLFPLSLVFYMLYKCIH